MELAKALENSPSIAGAGREVGMSRDVAHRTYKAIMVKAADRCEQLGIHRDRVLQRFNDWADNAQREVRANGFGIGRKQMRSTFA
jgi:hypothetical protein